MVAGRRTGRPPGPARAREVRRAELLDAAEEAVRRHGAAVSMEELEAAAGVTKPVLYAHFPGRAGLVAALAQRAGDRLLDAVTGALASSSEPQAVLRAGVGAFCDFVVDDAPLYRFLLSGPTDPDRGRRLVGEIGGRVAALLAERMAEPEDAVPWAFAVVGAVFFAAEAGLGPDGRGRDALVDSLVRLLWPGLAAALPVPPGQV